jgi:hypothetical protein
VTSSLILCEHFLLLYRRGAARRECRVLFGVYKQNQREEGYCRSKVWFTATNSHQVWLIIFLPSQIAFQLITALIPRAPNKRQTGRKKTHLAHFALLAARAPRNHIVDIKGHYLLAEPRHTFDNYDENRHWTRHFMENLELDSICMSAACAFELCVYCVYIWTGVIFRESFGACHFCRRQIYMKGLEWDKAQIAKLEGRPLKQMVWVWGLLSINDLYSAISKLVIIIFFFSP